MKTDFYKSFLFFAALLLSLAAFSQGLNPGQAARFGIDSDLRSDVATQGSFTAASSHDWFKTDGGTGLGLINTTGTEVHAQRIGNGENLVFTKKMQFPRYSKQDGFLLLEGSYSRDFYGIGSSAQSDKTVFSSSGGLTKESNKNWQNPTTWTTVPSGRELPSKTDIIDTYVHMRRNGTTSSGSDFSELFLMVGATTLSTDGDHFIDFEFYKERLNYNASTGKFETPASSSTGGRSPWTFDGNGEVKLFGDISLSFSFSSTQVSNPILYIWTDYNTYIKGKVARFSFVANSWNGEFPKAGYGYAQIVPNSGTQQVWGTVNQAQTAAPAWGTNSKEMGQVHANYAATTYGAGQFAEAAINLTAFGIDPLLSEQRDPCQPPLTRFMVKTRSSSAFSSDLQDFTGPYEFLDAPVPSAKTTTPGTLTCLQPTVQLVPEVVMEGAYYLWTTPDGNIVGDPYAAAITADKGGDYTVTAAAFEGCSTTSATVRVKEDKYKPKVVASILGTLTTDPFAFVTLKGDTTTSGSTGTSKGITWRWNGPGGFLATTQNASTQLAGEYTVTCTESSSGCFTSATANVTAMLTLPVKFTDIAVSTDKQTKERKLTWKMADVREVEKFVVEKSNNGSHFVAISSLPVDPVVAAYSFYDRASDEVTFYRIQAISIKGGITYSSIVKAGNSSEQNRSLSAYADGSGNLVVTFHSPIKQAVAITVLTMNGQEVKKVNKTVNAGTNVSTLTDLRTASPGIYLLRVLGTQEAYTTKVKL